MSLSQIESLRQAFISAIETYEDAVANSGDVFTTLQAARTAGAEYMAAVTEYRASAPEVPEDDFFSDSTKITQFLRDMVRSYLPDIDTGVVGDPGTDPGTPEERPMIMSFRVGDAIQSAVDADTSDVGPIACTAEAPYRSSDPIYQQVVQMDEYCCMTEWDSVCQNLYNELASGGDGDIPLPPPEA